MHRLFKCSPSERHSTSCYCCLSTCSTGLMTQAFSPWGWQSPTGRTEAGSLIWHLPQWEQLVPNNTAETASCTSCSRTSRHTDLLFLPAVLLLKVHLLSAAVPQMVSLLNKMLTYRQSNETKICCPKRSMVHESTPLWTACRWDWSWRLIYSTHWVILCGPRVLFYQLQYNTCCYFSCKRIHWLSNLMWVFSLSSLIIL